MFHSEVVKYIAIMSSEPLSFHLAAHLSFLLDASCSHNLEYDSSEEKNPRLILYNQKDEVVKVSCEFCEDRSLKAC